MIERQVRNLAQTAVEAAIQRAVSRLTGSESGRSVESSENELLQHNSTENTALESAFSVRDEDRLQNGRVESVISSATELSDKTTVMSHERRAIYDSSSSSSEAHANRGNQTPSSKVRSRSHELNL
ncbi:hypothetical protein Ciccas_006765 [Cichlidogyrus casuarinus]|uniref:Uncharacterized protein n=1 Tax=Cichlidogyrus casuarinus TaxID=1844966 RepID=A0ABD2Q7A7_9PLAT